MPAVAFPAEIATNEPMRTTRLNGQRRQVMGGLVAQSLIERIQSEHWVTKRVQAGDGDDKV